MMDVAELGIKHLCEDTLGYKVESAKSSEGEFYGSSLPIFKGKEEFHFYLYFKKDKGGTKKNSAYTECRMFLKILLKVFFMPHRQKRFCNNKKQDHSIKCVDNDSSGEGSIELLQKQQH